LTAAQVRPEILQQEILQICRQAGDRRGSPVKNTGHPEQQGHNGKINENSDAADRCGFQHANGIISAGTAQSPNLLEILEDYFAGEAGLLGFVGEIGDGFGRRSRVCGIVLRNDGEMEEGEYAERGNYGREDEWRFSEMHMASVPRLGFRVK